MGKIIDNDIFGKALLDYQSGNYTEDIITHSTISGKDEMELPWLFRTFDEMPMLEQTALKICKGKVLDVGCGAGSHSLYLQNKNLEIKAIDISEGAIETCFKRGVKNVKVQNIWDIKNDKYDTILALMNGVGISGDLANLTPFLNHLKTLLTINGQIIMDSSDVIYMYQDEFGEFHIPKWKNYYGEVTFEFQYKNEFSEKFKWLFVAFDILQKHAKEAGLECELIKEGYHYDYLARLSKK